MSLAVASFRRREASHTQFPNDNSSMDYKEKYKDLKRDILVKTESLEEKEREIEELVVQLTKIKRERSKIQWELESMDRNVDTFERENKRLKQKLTSLEKDKQDSRYEIEELQLALRRAESM